MTGLVTALAAIFKPKGLSSSDVVVKCRGALTHATGVKQKCGHMGTLDPMADGVLILGFGKAARLFELSQRKTKAYRATVEFGYTTDTLDAEGIVTDRCDGLPSEETLKEVTRRFVGTIEQIPPKYSALNIAGRRAYDLARRGARFVVPKRTVEVFSIEPAAFENDGDAVKAYTFDVVCGSGTYVRSLCRDIALASGTLGCMTSLTRTRSGNFCSDDCTPLAEFLADPVAHLIAVSRELDKLMPRVELDDAAAFRILNGRTVPLGDIDEAAVYHGGLLGVARRTDGGHKLDIRLCD